MTTETQLSKESHLPPGQKWRSDLPRFGLTAFATRFPTQIDSVSVHIKGEVEKPFSISDELKQLPFVNLTADFHCVTTWSCAQQQWGGYRFIDVWRNLIEPRLAPSHALTCVEFKGQDGYRSLLLLEDLLVDDVLLATHYNKSALTVEHGAPLRLIAPKHYGYKNVKHVQTITLLNDPAQHKPSGSAFMAHQRARVALEERAYGAPGWFFRLMYRPVINRTVKQFNTAMLEFKRKNL